MELKDIATLIEDQGRGWEAFKTANEERLKAIESKGYARRRRTVVMKTRLNRLNTARRSVPTSARAKATHTR